MTETASWKCSEFLSTALRSTLWGQGWGQMACHTASPLLIGKGPLETGCTSSTTHTHLGLITCYLLNLLILYQPVTCCLNASSSRGCQGFCLEGEIRFLLLVFLTSYQLFPTTVTKLGVKAGMMKPLQGCGRDTCWCPSQRSQQSVWTLEPVINFRVISIRVACSLTAHGIYF